MPWGTLLLGAMFSGLMLVITPQFITGTSSSDDFFRQAIPIGSVFIFGMIAVFGFAGKH